MSKFSLDRLTSIAAICAAVTFGAAGVFAMLSAYYLQEAEQFTGASGAWQPVYPMLSNLNTYVGLTQILIAACVVIFIIYQYHKAQLRRRMKP